ERQTIAEERPAFRDLASQRLCRQILHFVDRCVETPRPDIAIAPLRANREPLVLLMRLLQPASEKRFGHSVRTCGIDVTNADCVGSVEHLMTVTLELRDTAIPTEVISSSEVDIGRSPERGESKAEPADHQARRSKRMLS